jgi:hypothetical protein
VALVSSVGRYGRQTLDGYVSAMHWKELTTSSGPFSAKKLS